MPAPLRDLSSGPCAFLKQQWSRVLHCPDPVPRRLQFLNISDHPSIILSYKATLVPSAASLLLTSSQLRATLSHGDLDPNLLLPHVAMWPSAHSCTFPPLTSVSSRSLEKAAACLGSTQTSSLLGHEAASIAELPRGFHITSDHSWSRIPQRAPEWAVRKSTSLHSPRAERREQDQAEPGL